MKRAADRLLKEDWHAQYRSILPAESNIVKFQCDYYLVPLLSDERDVYNRVFGKTKLDMRTDSRDTTLRRAIIEYVEAGGQLHGAGGILLLAEMNN